MFRVRSIKIQKAELSPCSENTKDTAGPLLGSKCADLMEISNPCCVSLSCRHPRTGVDRQTHEKQQELEIQSSGPKTHSDLQDELG